MQPILDLTASVSFLKKVIVSCCYSSVADHLKGSLN